ncbi:hypothetical protein BST16_06530 [Mycobacterium asiaticum DSM 44297]|nr:hypothetical protein BST16_06530 [Mycobacterium asiaticum DSM 44297]
MSYSLACEYASCSSPELGAPPSAGCMKAVASPGAAGSPEDTPEWKYAGAFGSPATFGSPEETPEWKFAPPPSPGIGPAMVASPRDGAAIVASGDAAGAAIVASGLANGAAIVASGDAVGTAIVASAAAPRARAKSGSPGICTPIVDADCSWSANIAVFSGDVPTSRTSSGVPAWPGTCAIKVSKVAPASPSTGVAASTVGGASGSPLGTARLAVWLPTSRTAAPARPGPSSAVAACDSETTSTFATPA